MTLPNDNMQPTIGTDMVVLVDPNDKEIGLMEKMEAHEKGLLHRAFSFFIFNSKGEWLLQQRAWGKYHSPGLWTNACCSHPRRGSDDGWLGRGRRLHGDYVHVRACIPHMHGAIEAEMHAPSSAAVYD